MVIKQLLLIKLYLYNQNYYINAKQVACSQPTQCLPQLRLLEWLYQVTAYHSNHYGIYIIYHNT